MLDSIYHMTLKLQAGLQAGLCLCCLHALMSGVLR